MNSVLLNYAARNLLRTKLRSFFTLLSIVLIVALYTILASISQSFTRQISTLLDQQDIDIAVQARYADSPITSKISSQISSALSEMPAVRVSESLLISRKRINGKHSIFVLGVSSYDIFARKLGFNLVEGKTFSDHGREALLGVSLSKLFSLTVGDALDMDGRAEFEVTGIYSSWLNFINAGVVMNLQNAQEVTDTLDHTSLLFLTLHDPTQAQSIINEINKQYPTMLAIEGSQFPNHIGPIKSIFYFSRVVSLATLIVAIAVLLNTLNMAINERTKEVGILGAIGWSRWRIVCVFLFESLLMSFGGAIIGYLLAFPVMNLLKARFSGVSMFFPTSPDAEIFVNVLLMSVLIAIVSGLFPALYGTRLTVAEAVRHE